MAREVEWLNDEERELYAGAIYAALCWGEEIEKEKDIINGRRKKE